MPLIFSYGSLQEERVQLSTYGRRLAGRPDWLVGYEPSLVKIADPEAAARLGRTHYNNVTLSGSDASRVPGVVFEITDAELASTDEYELADGYRRVAATLASGQTAWVYRHVETGADSSAGSGWRRAAIAVAVVYLVLNLAPSWVSAVRPAHAIQARWAAFLLSVSTFLWHVRFDFPRYRRPLATAGHVAVAVGLGGLGLAIAANLHELGLATRYRPVMILTLVVWPVAVAAPAFVVALITAAILGMKDRRATNPPPAADRLS